ncbi:MAG: TonB-dependent receptor [Gemmatimonadaceae bacterium]
MRIRKRQSFLELFTFVACALVAFASATAQHATSQRGRHASSQADSVGGALDGSVRDTAGVPLVGVEIVAVDNPSVHARSGAGGAFRIDRITTGPHLIRFRRIGIVPLTVSVVVQPNTTTSVDAMVELMTIVLSRVIVQAPSGEILHLPFGVADRFRNGIGSYITAAEIAKEAPRETADLFLRVAGLQVSGEPGSRYVSTTRGLSALYDDVDDKGVHHTTTQCTGGMSVYVDGAHADGNIDIVPPNDIEAIEIYKDPVEIPVTLDQSPCGAIYIWTK